MNRDRGAILKRLVLLLVAVSMSALAMNMSKAAGTQVRSTGHNADQSGTFHLSENEPTKHLALQGKTGVLKINNIGPAALVVKNSRNNMTFDANSHASLTFEGDTDLSVSTFGHSRETDGSFEVFINHE